MRLLLDTHVLIWWLLNDPKLSASALSMLVDRSNQLFLSSATGFEIATKVALGKLRLPSDPATFIGSVTQTGAVQELPLTLEHTYRIAQLPMIHRDPFDRLLISTALAEGLTLLTEDAWVRQYPVPTTW